MVLHILLLVARDSNMDVCWLHSVLTTRHYMLAWYIRCGLRPMYLFFRKVYVIKYSASS